MFVGTMEEPEGDENVQYCTHKVNPKCRAKDGPDYIAGTTSSIDDTRSEVWYLFDREYGRYHHHLDRTPSEGDLRKKKEHSLYPVLHGYKVEDK